MNYKPGDNVTIKKSLEGVNIAILLKYGFSKNDFNYFLSGREFIIVQKVDDDYIIRRDDMTLTYRIPPAYIEGEPLYIRQSEIDKPLPSELPIPATDDPDILRALRIMLFKVEQGYSHDISAWVRDIINSKNPMDQIAPAWVKEYEEYNNKNGANND